MAAMETASEVERIAVLDSQIRDLRFHLEERFEAARMAVQLALSASEKTTSIAQATADKAVAKAEASAAKEYLESQIEGLRDAFSAQIIAQKEAMQAALAAAEKALSAAQASSEKAIMRADEATEKRFASVNEFRAQLGDQQKTFVVKSEAEFKFITIDKKLEEISTWQRQVDLRFANYVRSELYSENMARWTEWRRTVDAAMVAAASKTGLFSALMAMVIAAGGLLIAIFNMFRH